MHQLAPTQEEDRKVLARVVALARWDAERTRHSDSSRARFLADRLREAEAALALHDEHHPSAALAALLADGPRWNEGLYARRRTELEARVVTKQHRMSKDR